MSTLDPFGRDYLRLTLEIDKHVPGYVDSYLGPPELRAAVAAGPKKEAAALQEALDSLQARRPTADPARYAYLTAALRAMACTLQLIAGEPVDYLDEVYRLFDVRPQPVDETRFTAAHRELDSLLPGAGDLAERLQARRQPYELAPEQALPLIALAHDEARRRTAALFDLVEGEQVELALVADQPWSAYNWYLGNGRSRIEFNTDIPVNALALAGLVAHESYPGHHTEMQLKEKRFYLGQGYAEHASLLLHSPSAVIAEGIATTAEEIIFPAGSSHDWTANVLLPAAGLPVEPPEQMRRIAAAAQELRYVSGNAAILYHTGQLDQAQTIDYIQSYSQATPERARKSFEFISHPLYRAYVFTYTQGYDLIAAAAGADKRPLFQQLLTSQLLPSQLSGMANGDE